MTVEQFARKIGLPASRVRYLVTVGWPCRRTYGQGVIRPEFDEEHVTAWRAQLETNAHAEELAALSPRYRTREIRVAWEQSPGPPEAGWETG